MKNIKKQHANRQASQIIRASDIGRRRNPLLTLERAVNDNIPAQQLRETAQWQRPHERGRETRAHLATMARKLEQDRGW